MDGQHARDRIQNPSYPSYSPSVSQPPAQQPPFDPFQSRDPFMPATSPSRQNSHSHRLSDGANEPSRAHDMPHDTLQPAPPPPPSPFHSAPLSSFSNNRSRRSSVGGGFPGASIDRPPPPPPPPPSFLSRQMPPPPGSSPTQPHLSSPAARTSINSPPTFNGGRDTNGGSSHRSTGSMSIQSIMGSDTAPPQRSSTWSSYGGSGPAGSPPQPFASPRQEYSYGIKRETESADPRTPDRKSESRSYGSYSHIHTSMKSPNMQNRESYHTSEGDRRGLSHLLQPPDLGSSNHSAVPQRPYSQPSRSEGAAREPTQNPQYGPIHTSGDRVSMDVDKAVRDRAFSDVDGRRNSATRHEFSHTQHGSSAQSSNGVPEYSNGYSRQSRDGWSSPQRFGDQNSNSRVYESHRPSATSGENGPASAKFGPVGMPPDPHLHNDTFPGHQPSPQLQPGNGNVNGAPPPDNRLPGSFRPRTPLIDSQLRRSLEDSHMSHRSLLGISNDPIRRSDRASPLPQAVQGAQGQPVGSGRDPTIKTEFGRMFSGLGSGVGSTPQPPSHAGIGPPSSNRQSPFEDDVEMEPSRKGARDGESSKARNGRGNKRTRDDHDRIEGEVNDERMSPSIGAARGNKRTKNQTGAPHHHHHPHAHHHHHHPRAQGEEAQSDGQLSGQRSGGTPLGLRLTPGTTSSANNAGPHHHHHHHHHLPHHHHPVRKGSPSVQPFYRPITTIKTQPLLKSVAHLPRRHLGSQLYNPDFAVPSSTATMVDSKRTYTLAPNPIPRFDDKPNCTFTVRVPRYYLSRRLREEICAARHIWGTDIYTDDSDPVAAAIHSGWIRGVWPADVDVSLLDLTTSASSTSAPDNPAVPNGNGNGNVTLDVATRAPLTAPPPDGPLDPPAGTDMHLTLLLLPQLERYASSVWHGVRSRAWGANHDGMSFKVERVEWVDECAGRYDERGGAARRRRLKAAMAATQRARVGSARGVNGTGKGRHAVGASVG